MKIGKTFDRIFELKLMEIHVDRSKTKSIFCDFLETDCEPYRRTEIPNSPSLCRCLKESDAFLIRVLDKFPTIAVIVDHLLKVPRSLLYSTGVFDASQNVSSQIHDQVSG